MMEWMERSILRLGELCSLWIRYRQLEESSSASYGAKIETPNLWDVWWISKFERRACMQGNGTMLHTTEGKSNDCKHDQGEGGRMKGVGAKVGEDTFWLLRPT